MSCAINQNDESKQTLFKNPRKTKAVRKGGLDPSLACGDSGSDPSGPLLPSWLHLREA